MALTGRKMRTRRRTRSEFLVVVGVVGVVLLLQVLASTFAGAAALREADAATDEVFEFTADATAERILEFLQPAEDATIAIQSRIASEPATFATLDPFELIPLVDEHPQIGAVLVSFADGSVWAIHRPRGEGWELLIGNPEGGQDTFTVSALDASGGVGEPQTWADGHSFADAPWVRRGAEADAPLWPGIAPSELEDGPILHVLTSVRDGADPYAVVRVELRVGQLAQYLSELPLGEEGEAFVLSPARGVVAAPEAYNEVLRSLPMGGRPGPGEDGEPREGGPGPDGHPASELGIPEANWDALGTVYRDGKFLVLETPLDADGSPAFTLYLRATEAGVAPGIASFQRAMLIYSIVIGAVVLGGAILVAALRAPLERLRERAAHDHLTGLLNRGEFAALGDELLRAAERRDGTVAVAMFDLDNFKVVNDSMGHEAGDEALVAFARALENAARPRDIVARLGGDEFAVVRWLDPDEDPRAAVERIRSRAAEVFATGRFADLELDASAGFAVSGAGLNDLGALVSEADEALVSGKSNSKGRTSAVGT